MTSPRELWERLQSEAGLELRLKRGRRGRDADLEDEVIACLGLQVPGGLAVGMSLQQILSRDEKSQTPLITCEQLLVAVLTSQRGFSAMMEDILQLLVAADATCGDSELRLAFRFGDVTDPIRLTLEQFREQIDVVKRVLVTRFEPADSECLWGLLRKLRSICPKVDPAHQEPRADGFDAPAARAGTADAELDAMFGAILEIVAEFRAWCRQHASNRSDFWGIAGSRMQDPATPQEDRLTLERWRGPVSDFWDVNTLSHLRAVEWAVNAGSIAPEAVKSELRHPLAQFPRRQAWVDQTYRELLDILRLPTWRKRHELYSVWVGTVLLQAARNSADRFHFHTRERSLSFAFGGNRLASYETRGEQFDIWAELRSDLVGSSGKRKRGIQPDFRVVRVALGEKVNSATQFVLECKHYLQPSVSNFTQAAQDYGRSCPVAQVFVVNHGPLDHDRLITAVDSGVGPRVQFVGDATAVAERREPVLLNLIREKLFPPAPAASPGPSPSPVALAEAPPPAARPLEQGADGAQHLPPVPSRGDDGAIASITLKWDGSLGDLDLALELIDPPSGSADAVNYEARGDLAGPPFARLKEDVRSGPGVEVIGISSWSQDRYRIVVRNYSGTGAMSARNVVCRVTVHGLWTCAMTPTGEVADRWVVANIESATRAPWICAPQGTRSKTTREFTPAVPEPQAPWLPPFNR
jgi:hypothetical protein